MSSATVSGWETVTAWEASVSTVVEPARSAMNSIESAQSYTVAYSEWTCLCVERAGLIAKEWDQ